ncbi:site-2 protease family protein [Halovivax sp.]|uniref:site-2 protease family protein n=1 Tax=Halovivax sp. TaxID=1935978 RepID=UPI0025B9A220|nr:site-2 protease family protein [Halovivax sp.]
MREGPIAPAVVPELFGSALLTWTLIGLLAYWAGLIALRQRDLLPGFVGAQGPIVTLHTTRGRDFLDWLSGPKRFWRAWANFGIGISLVVMVAMFVFLLGAAISSVIAPEPTDVQQPQNILVIPGVNEFLPLSATPGIVFGLFVGLVVHEGGHGLLCRVEDIEIESMGVAMLAILPIGAFVEPDEESSREASRGGQTRMFAAGVTNNFVVTIVAFALLFWIVGSAIAVAPGAAVGGVVADSPAEAAGIEANDRITALDGEPVENNAHFADLLEANDAETLTVELDGDREVTVERAPIVVAALENGPAGVDLHDRILEVDGEPVATEGQLIEAVGDDEAATLAVESPDGERGEREVPIGASVQVLEDGPLADAGAPADEFFVITVADGERVHDAGAFADVLEERAGETVALEGYVDGERERFEAELRPDSTQFDQALHDGVTAMEINDLGVQLYPAEEFHGVLGGGGDQPFGALGDSFFGQMFVALLLPIVGLLGMQFNFAGFAGGVENFYEVQGALGALGEPTVFMLANLLFWTAWINLNLGFFNCIPAFPLDGGHILRTSTEAIVSRLPLIDATRGRVRVVTTLVGVTMLLSFVLMVFGPTLLAG